MMRHLRQGFLALLLLLPSLTACDGTVERTYTSLHARFRFTPVTAMAPLYTALNSPGQFCTIRFDQKTYIFTLSDGTSSTYPRTAIEAYGKPLYITGFLVGTPAVPDLSGNFYSVAFDLACPVCYEEAYLERDVSISASTPNTATCPRCHSAFDLNNGGICINKAGAHGLYRYRFNYSPATDLFMINN